MQVVICLEKYFGKAKDVEILNENEVKITFRDSISAFDGVKKEDLQYKGETNCKTSAKLFEILKKYHVETHYITRLSDNELLCKKVEIVPVEIVCRNIAAGSICRRYNLKQGLSFTRPIIEFFLKDDSLHDPLITEEVAIQLKYLSYEDALLMKSVTLAVNHILKEIFQSLSLVLVDFKLEFGKNKEGILIIADEISADTMRLWEKDTGEIKDKDRYRKDLGDVISHYKDILNRLEKMTILPKLDFLTRADILISLKESVRDPAGEVTLKSLQRNDYTDVKSVRLGKSAKLELSKFPSNSLYVEIKDISTTILSNPLIEEIRIIMDYDGKNKEG